MRSTGHPIDVNLLREDHDDLRDGLAEIDQKRPEQLRNKNALYFDMYVADGLRAAALAYLFDAPVEEVRAILGRVLEELVTVVDLGGILDPIRMRVDLGAALVSRNGRMIDWLGTLPVAAYASGGIEVSQAAYFLVASLQAGARGDRQSFEAAARDFRHHLADDKLVVDPKSERAIYEPLADLLEAVATGDGQALSRAWENQAKAWKKRFGRPAEKANVDSILDFETLGIGIIARGFGLEPPDTNPYAPGELL